MRLLLASNSPRRAELLRCAAIPFDVYPVDVDEELLRDETATQYVRRLAAAKSAAAARDHPHALVLGADTAVVVDGEVLGKPADDVDAARMLRRLSGRAHQVITGVCLQRGERQLDDVVTTTVTFLELSEADVSSYVESGEGRDKAGAYAIQGIASRFVSRIEGSYSNVVGLPVSTVWEMMKIFENAS